MSDRVIIMHSTKNGLVKDTIIDKNDTLNLDVSGIHTIELPEKPLSVKTQGKDNFEYFVDIVTILGVIIAAIYTLSSFKKLFKRDEQKDEQIRELSAQTAEIIKQTKLQEKRIRMLAKPRLWTNGGGYDADGTVRVMINNRGHLCFLNSWGVIEGDNVVFVQWKDPMEIDNGEFKTLTGTPEEHPKNIRFVLLVSYTDQEGYEYESTFEYNKGSVQIIETKEL
jgi:hypothetical protein